MHHKMLIPYFLVILVLSLEITQAQLCDGDIFDLFVRKLNSTAFSYWYSTVQYFAISMNAQLKSTSTNGTMHVLQFQAISFNVT